MSDNTEALALEHAERITDTPNGTRRYTFADSGQRSLHSFVAALAQQAAPPAAQAEPAAVARVVNWLRSLPERPRDHPYWTNGFIADCADAADVIAAAPTPAAQAEPTGAQVRRAFEEAMIQSWRMIDPLCPAGQPGSYARGQDAGIIAALTTVRENFKRLLAAAPTPAAPAEPVALEPYDAGLLSDFGGGNVEWWQDYIRAELGRAHEFYQSQVAAPTPAAQAEPVAPEWFAHG